MHQNEVPITHEYKTFTSFKSLYTLQSRLDTFSSYPVALKANEFQQPHDPRRQERNQQVERADAEPDPALKVVLVLGVGVLPVPLVEGVPALPEGLEAGPDLQAGLDKGDKGLILAEREASSVGIRVDVFGKPFKPNNSSRVQSLANETF